MLSVLLTIYSLLSKYLLLGDMPAGCDVVDMSIRCGVAYAYIDVHNSKSVAAGLAHTHAMIGSMVAVLA